MASQFSGKFTLQVPGSTKKYNIAEPISLLVVTGNTVSPITGVYNIISVAHTVTDSFITTLEIQRLVMSSANEVASNQNIFVNGSSSYAASSYKQTSNIVSTGKVDFGELYPTFEHMTDMAW